MHSWKLLASPDLKLKWIALVANDTNRPVEGRKKGRNGLATHLTGGLTEYPLLKSDSNGVELLEKRGGLTLINSVQFAHSEHSWKEMGFRYMKAS